MRALASIGERVLKALRGPVVSVISTGSRLTEPGESEPGQDIRQRRIYAFCCRRAGHKLKALTCAEMRTDEAQRLIEEAPPLLV